MARARAESFSSCRVVALRVQSSLKTCTVRSGTRGDRRSLTCANTFCSLASRRIRTWRLPVSINPLGCLLPVFLCDGSSTPSAQNFSWRNSSTPSRVRASRRHLSSCVKVLGGVVCRSMVAEHKHRGNMVAMVSSAMTSAATLSAWW